MNDWNSFDFLIFLILILNTLLGMSRAATKEIISTVSLSVALICSIKFTIPLTLFLNKSPLLSSVIADRHVQGFVSSLGLAPVDSNMLAQLFYSLSLLICFVGVFSLCEGVLGIFGIVEMYPFPYAMLNRKIGIVLGGVRGYVISIILISICVLHIFKDNNNYFRGSFFVNLFGNAAVKFDRIIGKQQPEQYRDIFQDKNLYNPVKAIEEFSKPALQNSDAEPAVRRLYGN